LELVEVYNATYFEMITIRYITRLQGSSKFHVTTTILIYVALFIIIIQ